MSEHPDYDCALGCCCEQCSHLGCDDCPFHKGICWTYEEGKYSAGSRVVFFPVPEEASCRFRNNFKTDETFAAFQHFDACAMRDSRAKLDNLVQLNTWKRRKLAALPIQEGEFVLVKGGGFLNKRGPFRVTRVREMEGNGHRKAWRLLDLDGLGPWSESRVRRVSQKMVG
jgi:hypothetical protein